MSSLNSLRERLITPVRTLKDTLPARAPGKVYIEALTQHWQATALREKIEARAAALESLDRRQEASEYRQIMDILAESAVRFAAVMGEDEMTRGDFLSLFELMLAQYTIGTIPVSLDAVEFSDFRRAAFDRIDHLFILGAHEGALPPVVTGSGLLKERDRILLETLGIELTQSDEERVFEYISGIYQAVNSAVKTLAFTVPRHNAKGETSSASFLLGRLTSLYDGLTVTDASPTVRRNSLLAAASAFETLCLGGESAENDAAAAFFRDTAEEERHRALLRCNTAKRGPISDLNSIKGLYGSTLYMSYTRADQINSCRFSYFMKYGLRAAERRVAEFRATDVGSLVHGVIERSVKELIDDPTLTIEAAVHKNAEDFLRTRLGGERGKTARFMANFRKIVENIVEIVRDIMEEIARSDFKPIAYEMDFGTREEGMPPLRIESNGLPMEVHGSIDRVDGMLDGDTLRLRVSDYKTGSKAFRLTELLDGINMQMFIYLLMLLHAPRDRLADLAERELGRRPSSLQPCAALYIPVKRPYVEIDADSEDDEIASARQGEVKRFGLVLDDRSVIDALEHRKGDTFRFLPVKYNKNGSFSSGSDVADARGFYLLLERTKRNLRKIAETVSGGDIEADPYFMGSGRSYCDWCPYAEACQFDTTMGLDRLRYLKKYSDRDVFAMLNEEAEDHGD